MKHTVNVNEKTTINELWALLESNARKANENERTIRVSEKFFYAGAFNAFQLLLCTLDLTDDPNVAYKKIQEIMSQSAEVIFSGIAVNQTGKKPHYSNKP